MSRHIDYDPIERRLEGRASHLRSIGQIKTPDLLEEAADRLEGLNADLDSAVEVAFKRGATEWVRLNYPEHFKRLSTAARERD